MTTPYDSAGRPAQPPETPAGPQPPWFGVEAATGLPYSDKSKVAAALLQLLPGLVLGLGGIGRLYAGNTGLGVAQLAASLFGWISLLCSFLLFFPIFLFLAAWLWFVVDGIVILAGRPVDGRGLPLRS